MLHFQRATLKSWEWAWGRGQVYWVLCASLCYNYLIIVGQAFSLLSLDAVIAISSSTTIFIVSSAVFFVIGYVCRSLCHKPKNSTNDADYKTVTSPPNVTYEDIKPKAVEHRNKKHDVELTENAAYMSIVCS